MDGCCQASIKPSTGPSTAEAFAASELRYGLLTLVDGVDGPVCTEARDDARTWSTSRPLSPSRVRRTVFLCRVLSQLARSPCCFSRTCKVRGLIPKPSHLTRSAEAA